MTMNENGDNGTAHGQNSTLNLRGEPGHIHAALDSHGQHAEEAVHQIAGGNHITSFIVVCAILQQGVEGTR